MQKNRSLAPDELRLARWMLENGGDDARTFLPQLDLAQVTPWKCACGCASIQFRIKGQPEAPPGVHILGDYVFGNGELCTGIFIFESAGILSGIEVYGLSDAAPASMPSIGELRHFRHGAIAKDEPV